MNFNDEIWDENTFEVGHAACQEARSETANITKPAACPGDTAVRILTTAR